MTTPYDVHMRKEKPMREVTHKDNALMAGDILCTEYGDFLVVKSACGRFFELLNTSTHKLVGADATPRVRTGDYCIEDDFLPFLGAHDVYNISRLDVENDEPTHKYNVSDSGPFRECNITLGTLQAINANDFVKAVDHATYANPDMTRHHIEDFVLYLMET